MVVLALGAQGCDEKKSPSDATTKQAATTPPKAVPSKPQINPHETPEARAAQQPMLRSQEGNFDLIVDGVTRHLPHLPFGQNAAIHFEGKKGRITVSGADADGYPRFTATMIGWQLDKLDLPVTLTGDGKQIVRFKYQVGERGDYKSDDEATKRGENKVTLESYEGNVLTGTFEGTVARATAKAGEPLVVSGKFSAALRLRGVERAAPPGDAAAKPDDSKAADSKPGSSKP